MSFWNGAIQLFWDKESILVLAAMFCLVFLLFQLLPEERKSVLNTQAFFIISLVIQFFGSLIQSLPYIGSALQEAGLIGAGIAVIRLVGLLVFRILLPLLRAMPPRIAEDIFVIIGYLVWALVRLRYAGLDPGSIVATSAVITAILAFSMQDTLGNILGGLALQLDNSIGIGDWIKVDQISGRVVDIRWRSTLVETRNWETVVFPNSLLMKKDFMVLGRRTDQPVQWRRWVWFNVNLGATPTRVVSAIEDAVQQAEINHVSKNPQPDCVLMEMDKGCARYALRYWLTDFAADDTTDASLRWHIYTALERAGIKLAVEEQNVRYSRENEKLEESLRSRELLRRIKTLKRVELFAQMTEVELRHMAERLRYAPFAKGNIIAKQGTPAQHWLFIITSGEAEVYLERPGGVKHVLNVLGNGAIFGEMSLMTGSPRVATVIARSDVECYRLDKDVFEEILLARPSIAEEVSHVLESRRMQLDSALQNMDEADKHKLIHHPHGDVLEKIIRFFGL